MGNESGFEYKTLAGNLRPDFMGWIFGAINDSGKYILSSTFHIFYDNQIVGYIGDDNFQLVNPNDSNLREHHKNLKSLFYLTKDEFTRHLLRIKPSNLQLC